MGRTLALLVHIIGTIFAAVLIYFLAPYMARVSNTEVTFNYLVLYALLAIWSLKEASAIESGKHKKANELDEMISKDKK